MKSIVFIQFGDFKEAAENFDAGGDEKYYAQKHSVDYVNNLKKLFDNVTVICMSSVYHYQHLSSGVGVFGAAKLKKKELYSFLDSIKVTHIVCRTPNCNIIKYALKKNISLLPLIADSFSKKSIRGWYREKLLSYYLNSTKIKCIGNHSVNASKSLSSIGVNTDKIIPWDWPHKFKPEMFSVKSSCSEKPILFYAGQISEEKGVFDIVDAVEILSRHVSVIFQVAGRDENNSLKKYVSNKQLNGTVEFLGYIPQKKVIEFMRVADIVVIPSRPQYPEGLPMTFYEGLLSRTPVIVSSHEMLKDKVSDGLSGLVFQAGNPKALAEKCNLLINDKSLYQTLSANSAAAWYALNIKVEWSELIDKFINDDFSQDWIREKSLISYLN